MILTGSQGTLRAEHVEVVPQPATAGSTARSAVQVAHATGSVRVTSQPKPDERTEATGTAANGNPHAPRNREDADAWTG